MKVVAFDVRIGKPDGSSEKVCSFPDEPDARKFMADNWSSLPPDEFYYIHRQIEWVNT